MPSVHQARARVQLRGMQVLCASGQHLRGGQTAKRSNSYWAYARLVPRGARHLAPVRQDRNIPDVRRLMREIQTIAMFAQCPSANVSACPVSITVGFQIVGNAAGAGTATGDHSTLRLMHRTSAGRRYYFPAASCRDYQHLRSKCRLRNLCPETARLSRWPHMGPAGLGRPPLMSATPVFGFKPQSLCLDTGQQ